LYLNGDDQHLLAQAPTSARLYTAKGCASWRISQVQLALSGTKFTLSQRSSEQNFSVTTSLLGAHHLGIIAAAAQIATDLGLTPAQIHRGVHQLHPFPHRLAPKTIAGATIIDDTYNGNPVGVRAGINLLRSLPATRRIYVTPGLVEQGSVTSDVHHAIGQQLAAAHIDIIVLFRNSVTSFIQAGLTSANFAGRLLVLDDPLAFYQQLDTFVIPGDVVLLQNDWPDNYA
jgi:UDP-N-acetylmuramoyl-tripeptide--D-alanyl-D-alanine ligase